MQLAIGQRWRWKYSSSFSLYSDLIIEIVKLDNNFYSKKIVQIIYTSFANDYIGKIFSPNTRFDKNGVIQEHSEYEYLQGQDSPRNGL